MERFVIKQKHVKEQFDLRYGQFAERSDEIIDRVSTALINHTPDDWRFTESPTSRFFVIEEESHAKFMGLSFRDGPRSRAIVSEIQNNLNNFKFLFDNLEQYIREYINELTDPNLPIIHQIRTVYPQKKGDIVEERRLFEQTKSAVTHIIPLTSRKIASRPNAVVSRTGTLWVRQYMNWVSMKEGGKEYYLFHPLTKDGIQRDRCAVFSYSFSGKLAMLPEKTVEIHFPDLSHIKHAIFSQAIEDGMKTDSDIRSESYWKVPTYLDRRLIDLDFKERHLHRSIKTSLYYDEGRTVSLELLELYMLRKIIEKARKQLDYDS